MRISFIFFLQGKRNQLPFHRAGPAGRVTLPGLVQSGVYKHITLHGLKNLDKCMRLKYFIKSIYITFQLFHPKVQMLNCMPTLHHLTNIVNIANLVPQSLVKNNQSTDKCTTRKYFVVDDEHWFRDRRRGRSNFNRSLVQVFPSKWCPPHLYQ